MTIAARLTGVGTFFAYECDEVTVTTKFRIGNDGIAYSNEFDENTSSTLSGSKMMRGTSTGGLIVLDSLNEVDPIETTFSTTGLQLHIDPVLSTKVETFPVGQTAYTTAGTFTFTVPPTITSISAVCVGGGGGGAGGETGRDEGVTGGAGGALCYGTIPVTPGESLTITVGSGGNGGSSGNDGTAGGLSRIARGATNLITANGGSGGQERSTGTVSGGTRSVDASVTNSGGGNGGNSGGNSTDTGSGGGGAGGYSGNGGNGGTTGNGSAGSGGGGGGGGATSSGQGYGGGGVGILGAGSNGTAGVLNSSGGGRGSYISGSFPTSGTRPAGGAYGGGGGACDDDTNGAGGAGGVGAVRIIWGAGRSYPSTSVTDATVVNYSFTLSDLSGNGRTASSVNEAFWSSTIPSTPTATVSLDGVNDYVTVASYKGVTGTGARTSIIWFKTSAINLSPRLFGWGNTTAGQKWNMSIDPTTYKARAEIATGSVVGGSTTPDLADSHWHMIAASAPASGTANDIKLYVDGDLLTDVTITSGATAINTASGSDVSFGASLADASPGYLSGNVSRFLIYNTQLTDFEIKVVYRDILNRFFPS
jgi:hypothetical protein